MSIFVDSWIPAPIVLPEGHVEFVIGDSHGHLELLKPLVEKAIQEEPTCFITFLGDVIDRGPNSLDNLKYALNTILERKKEGFGGEFLIGNHEGMLLMTLCGDIYMSDIFYSNGGKWLYEEFHAIPHKMTYMEWFKKELGEDAFNLLTKNGILLKKYNNNEIIPDGMLYRNIGNLILVHAGVNPSFSHSIKSIKEWLNHFDIFNINDEDHPLWIRGPFIYSKCTFDNNIIVHGHTFECKIMNDNNERKKPGHHCLEGNRFGLDAGSFYTGYVAGVLFKNGYYKVITSS